MPLYKSKTGKLAKMSMHLATMSNARTQAGWSVVANNFQDYNRKQTARSNNYLKNPIADFQKREAAALAANKKREAEIRGTYADIISQYQSGGAFKAAGLADIEESKVRAVGAGTQQLISSGLYGTTTAAALPVQAENQAQRSRLKLEDILQERTNQAKLGLAGFVERIDEPYPDFSMLMNAMAARTNQ